MTRTRIPDPVLTAAHRRAAARAAHDWAEADRLRAEIEQAGWRVADRGTDFALHPAVPPDVADGGSIRHGSSASVPSVLGDPAVGPATIVLVGADDPSAIDRALGGLAAHARPDVSVVVVADGDVGKPDPGPGGMSGNGLQIEVVRTNGRFGNGEAIDAGVRRASGRVVILLDPTVEPTGDLVTPLAEALDDPSVAVAGPWGVRTSDLRRFEEVGPGDAVAIDGACLAFNRSEYVPRGEMDRRYRTAELAAIWLSLVLRDEGEGRPPRVARVVPGVPVVRHARSDAVSGPTDPVVDRLRKRDSYRLLDRFGRRADLLRVSADPLDARDPTTRP